jgi:hypothetical protein
MAVVHNWDMMKFEDHCYKKQRRSTEQLNRQNFTRFCRNRTKPDPSNCFIFETPHAEVRGHKLQKFIFLLYLNHLLKNSNNLTRA